MSTIGSGGAGGRRNEHQTTFLRQANILRKNLYEWHYVLRDSRGEDWPKMCGRLNTAMNQAGSLDDCIDDVLEHFVYVPKKCVMNPQDIPVFLSSRVEVGNAPSTGEDIKKNECVTQSIEDIQNPVAFLQQYETRSRNLASKFERSLVRF